jgi:hypothetical protein
VTKVLLLKELKTFTEKAVEDLILPVRRQEEDETDPEPRAALVYLVRLPELRSMEKKAPYILHNVAEGTDKFVNVNAGYGGREVVNRPLATCEVRSVFCVYDGDVQEGGLWLLELMERLRLALLRKPVLGPFQLDWNQGMETKVYDNVEYELGPYHVGGMVTHWVMPTVDRMDVQPMIHGADRRLPPMWGGGPKQKGESENGEQKD